MNESEPLILTFGITLQQIIDVVRAQFVPFGLFFKKIFQDEKNQMVITCLWLNLVSRTLFTYLP